MLVFGGTYIIVLYSVLVNYIILGGEKKLVQLSAFGKEIKKRLVDIDSSQEWLIEQVQRTTGMFFDSGYLYKILTGQRSAPKIVQAIKEILGLQDEDSK